MHILIQWKPEYELGLKEIDQHHRKLVDLINIVYDSLIDGHHIELVERIIGEMADYAFVHFKYEERFFEKFGYEFAEEHINEHRSFIHKIREIQQSDTFDAQHNNQELLEFLKYWLNNHIIHSDKKYVDCFVKSGLQ